MPIAECIPTIDQVCKLVGEGRNLTSFASLYGTTATVLLGANADVLAGDATVHPGMVLRVPLVNPTPPSPCVDNEQWGCVTVSQGDTLTTIAKTQAVDPNNLCTWNVRNGVSNCSLIEIGQVLAFPKHWIDDGLVGCEIIPGLIPSCYTNMGMYPHYLNNIPPLYSVDYATSKRFDTLNAFITPSGTGYGGAEIWPGVTVRVPGRRCMPTHDYDCVSIGDWTRAMNPPDGRPFSQDGYIRYIDENRWWLNEQVGVARLRLRAPPRHSPAPPPPFLVRSRHSTKVCWYSGRTMRPPRTPSSTRARPSIPGALRASRHPQGPITLIAHRLPSCRASSLLTRCVTTTRSTTWMPASASSKVSSARTTASKTALACRLRALGLRSRTSPTPERKERLYHKLLVPRVVCLLTHISTLCCMHNLSSVQHRPIR